MLVKCVFTECCCWICVDMCWLSVDCLVRLTKDFASYVSSFNELIANISKLNCPRTKTGCWDDRIAFW